jgi:hypothetical protein
MAADLGYEPRALLNKIREGDTKLLGAMLTTWQERLRAGDADAVKLADDLKDLTPDDMKGWVKDFDNGIPFDAKEYAAQMAAAMTSHADEWLVKWFNIKPDGLVTRMFSTLKSAQTYFVIGLNFQNAVQNTIKQLRHNGVAGRIQHTDPETAGELDGRAWLQPVQTARRTGAGGQLPLW